MRAVILAGGKGTRFFEEIPTKPKPMVEIESKPILWYILKIFSSYKINDFIISCVYKAYLIKEYLYNYLLRTSNIILNLKKNSIKIHHTEAKDWNITLVDTGEEAMTVVRLLRVKNYIGSERFAFTYGDSLSDKDIQETIYLNKKNKKLTTVTARPPCRYGALEIKNNSQVYTFFEKLEGENSWINEGFFILEPEVINLIKGDESFWEEDCLYDLIKKVELNAFKNDGFCHPMYKLKDKNNPHSMLKVNNAPWIIWK